jgi:GTP-binding protein
MTFLDEADVEFVSGRGGSGAVSFHREKFVPLGGPNGADGGRGGDVVLIADRNKRTLYDFKLNPKFKAGDGDHGVGNKRGKDGKSIEVRVPVGTVITDMETGDVLADLAVNGVKLVLAKGGKGGQGNLHYANSIRQAPNFAQKGAPAETLRVHLELKLLADVGLIGLPNAGKSTLISRISAARPKIADYPFTTIVPNLGVVSFRDTSFVVADMPGLIEGASLGVGLGHQFLRHVERTRVLIHIVDARPVDESDPVENFKLIEREISLYSDQIFERPRVVALNKIDLIDAEQVEAICTRLKQFDMPVFPISAVAGQGLDALLHKTTDLLERAQPAEEPTVLFPALKLDEQSWDVVASEGTFEVTGKRIIRMIEMTDLNNREGLHYMQQRLQRIGVIDKLRQMGAQEGDSVVIGDYEFAFTDES